MVVVVIIAVVFRIPISIMRIIISNNTISSINNSSRICVVITVATTRALDLVPAPTLYSDASTSAGTIYVCVCMYVCMYE